MAKHFWSFTIDNKASARQDGFITVTDIGSGLPIDFNFDGTVHQVDEFFPATRIHDAECFLQTHGWI